MSTSYNYRKTWREAQDYCRMYGGNLVSVHNSTEAAGLKKYVFRYALEPQALHAPECLV